jgi:hypothetical protein
LKTADGHQRIARHGHLPEREVMAGIGPVAVRRPRVRAREAAATWAPVLSVDAAANMRHSKSIETLLPILYLKGISTGDFSEALPALLGNDAGGLSASAIGRLQDVGLTSTPRGRSAICRRSATSTSGPTASIPSTARTALRQTDCAYV